MMIIIMVVVEYDYVMRAQLSCAQLTHTFSMQSSSGWQL